MPNAESLLRQGRNCLAALKVPSGWDVELYLEQERSRETAWGERKPRDTRSGFSQGAALRILHKGRQGFAWANAISPEAVRKLWDKASGTLGFFSEDVHRLLPSPSQPRTDGPKVDKTLFTDSVKRQQARLAAWEKSILKSDKRLKKVLTLSLRETVAQRAILNSRGVALESHEGAVSLDTELLGQAKGETNTSWSYGQKRFWKDLDADFIFDGAKQRLLQGFGAKALPTGNWPVIVDPWVGVEFLDLFSSALSAEAVQRGKSLFAGKKDAEVASPLVTLIDDGVLKNGLATSPFDDEGVPCQTTTLIRQGVLQGYLYDTYTAAKENRASTGNGRRPGFAGTPSCDATNFYMAPGRVSFKKLLADTPKAFWVHEVLGMHTADAVSGDFSVGASGVLVERGKVVRAVKGVTLAGNLLQMLKHVDAVADDLVWHGSTGAPTFRVSSLSVGGS
jgi:PmbA protein